jgi:predicted nucleic acid-binding protein
MIVVSDTNILSSFAATNALFLLSQAFPNDTIHIPPAVEQELQVALAFGKQHIERIFTAIENGAFHRIELTDAERLRMATLPSRLNAGEREGIVLCQARKLLFLSNDRRAVRYCETNAIEVAALTTILRLLWVRQIVTQDEVKALIEVMIKVERLELTDFQRALIFAPHRSPRRGRK